MRQYSWSIFGLLCLVAARTEAGMPAPLMSFPDATTDTTASGLGGLSEWAIARLDAISFFLVAVLITAGVLQWIWNSFRTDFSWLPRISYWRALALIVVWGCLFMVVLTMISGARELMTPGAWVREGATYRLVDPKPSNSLNDKN